MNLIDLLYQSKEIKRLIVQRSTEYKIPLRYLCLEVGIDYGLFIGNYINGIVNNNKVIPEAKFIKLLDELGIDVRYQ